MRPALTILLAKPVVGEAGRYYGVAVQEVESADEDVRFNLPRALTA